MLNRLSILVLLCLHSVEVLSMNTNTKTSEKVIYQLDDIHELFKEFTNKYNKKYNSEEFEHRRNVFVDNLIKINRWNREQSDVVYGINPFTDLTFEEFVKTYTGVRGNVTNDNLIPYKPTGMAPDSLDWRDSNLVTEVKNQGLCGSCYIFSAIGNIEGQYAKQHGQLISLSEQQSLDCNSNGCGGGYPDAVMQALANSGCMKESDYPYEGQQGQCHTDQSKIVVKVTGGNKLSIASEDDLKDAVANYGPLSIVININEELKSFPGGIFKPKSCAEGLHAVLLIGYGTGYHPCGIYLSFASVGYVFQNYCECVKNIFQFKNPYGGVPYWLIKNSWGQEWSEAGYVRMIRGQAACNIGMYAATATVA